MFARISCTGGRKTRAAHLSILLTGLALIWLPPVAANAEDKVVVESKWVEAGATDVHLGIYLENQRPIDLVLVPLEIRMIHVGSFIRRTLKIEPGGRLREWAGDDIMELRNFYPYRSTPDRWYNRCPLDSMGHVWRWMSWDSLPDFMGEEALMYFVSKMAPGELAPGNDGTIPDGRPSITLSFDVTDVGGAFEIDTTCASPANHIAFMGDGEDEVIAPKFERGIVLIGCNAECHGDPDCDGECTILDMVSTVDVAFKGAPPIIDPDPRCPTEDSDVNCDMQTDVLDVICMINVLYRSQPMASQFCQACDLAPQPGGPKKDPRTPYFRRGGD